MKAKLFTTIITSIFITFASAQIIHVPGDQSNIQSGINAASNGDTVLVAEGTYYENINFWGKAITVASNFILDGDTNYINNTIIDGSQPSNPDYASVVSFTTGEDTTSIISGFTITGGTGILDVSIPARLGGGIVCINASAKICHNKIFANTVDHQTAGIGAGIACTMYLQSNWIVIEHNTIADNYNHAIDVIAQGGGIYIGENTGFDIELRARVSFNTIENNSCYSDQQRADGGGIKIEGSDGVSTIIDFNYNLVKNNYIRGSSTRGAGLCGIMAGADIENNVFSGNYIDETSVQFRGAAICFKYPFHRVNIINNQISNNSVPLNYSDCFGAVSMMDGYETPIIVDMNFFTNNVGYWGAGFYSRRCYNLIVSNNVFSGNSAYRGGALASKHNSTDTLYRPLIVNNTFTGNTANDAGGAIRFFGESGVPVIFNCIFWENEAPLGKDILNESNLDMVISYSDIDTDGISGLWNGEENINDDPLFFDPENGDFHIDMNSPCAGAGIDSLEVNGIMYNCPLFDFEGNSRPMPSTYMPDMGADEVDEGVGILTFEQRNDIPVITYPNPFTSSTEIKYELQQSSTVQITIYNYQGKMIESIPEKHQSKGKHNFTWYTENLPSGVYYCTLSTANRMQTIKMIKMK